MDPAVLILASSSLPILAHNAYWLHRERSVDGYYGIIAGIYTFIAAILVAFGFPGSLIMPVSFGIISLGGFHSFYENKRRGKIAKGIAFLALAAGIYLAGVLL